MYQPEGTLNLEALENHKREFADKHQQANNLLVSTVHSMVEPNEADRPDFLEIQEQLPPYDDVKVFMAQKNPNGISAVFEAPVAARMSQRSPSPRMSQLPQRHSPRQSQLPQGRSRSPIRVSAMPSRGYASPPKRVTTVYRPPVLYQSPAKMPPAYFSPNRQYHSRPVPTSTTMIHRPAITTTIHHTPTKTTVTHKVTPGRTTVTEYPVLRIDGYTPSRMAASRGIGGSVLSSPIQYSGTGKKRRELTLNGRKNRDSHMPGPIKPKESNITVNDLVPADPKPNPSPQKRANAPTQGLGFSGRPGYGHPNGILSSGFR